MANEIYQFGTTVVVGFGSQTHADLIMQVVSGPNPGSDSTPIKGHNAETVTVLVADKFKTLSLDGVVTSLTAIEALTHASTLTVDSIVYRVTNVSIDRTAKETHAKIDLIKEDSMTYA